ALSATMLLIPVAGCQRDDWGGQEEEKPSGERGQEETGALEEGQREEGTLEGEEKQGEPQEREPLAGQEEKGQETQRQEAEPQPSEPVQLTGKIKSIDKSEGTLSIEANGKETKLKAHPAQIIGLN